ncbi:hypothetical protein RDABS01_005204 [Bienertia sinuspersici]
MEYHYCNPSSLTTSSTTSSSSSSVLSYSGSLTLTNKQQCSPPFKYKGVVPQPNGRWGAQLYNSNKRVWIGTYDTQHQAANAYDMAIIRFRGAQAITNFPIHHYGRPHLKFLATLTQARVIDMLRNHTYEDELARFIRAHNREKKNSQMGLDQSSTVRELMFKKVLTPSDVGRLHRLVIPKHHAESYLPKIAHDYNGENVGRETMLCFEDGKKDRIWRFKYCYWKSSQNYVLTKGWGEFVKDKGLKPGDTLLFHSSNSDTNIEGSSDNNSKRLFIDHTRCKEQADVVKDATVSNDSATSSSSDRGSDNGNGEIALSSSNVVIRLFGVDICPLVRTVVTVGCDRMQELDGGGDARCPISTMSG